MNCQFKATTTTLTLMDSAGGGGGGHAIHKIPLNVRVKEIPGQNAFEESLWCELKLKDADKLLLGVVYRSPNCPKENHDCSNIH